MNCFEAGWLGRRARERVAGMPLDTSSRAAEGYALAKRREETCVKMTCPTCGRGVYRVCATTGKCLVCLAAKSLLENGISV